MSVGLPSPLSKKVDKLSSDYADHDKTLGQVQMETVSVDRSGWKRFVNGEVIPSVPSLPCILPKYQRL